MTLRRFSLFPLVAVTIAALMSLCGCANNTTSQQSANMAQYQTFGFVPQSGIPSRATSLAHSAVSQELMSRGMRPSDNPDVLVNVHVFANRQVKMPRNSSLGFAAARYPFLEEYYSSLPPGYHANVSQYTEGHLTVDMLDTRQKRVVWRGQANKPVTRRVLNNPTRAMDQAVGEAFRSFPSQRR
uniref:DUF4136 domain-containing protein n=1 Tax=Microbulbifer agarilyticus TaxID=260552 RepID=UPI000255BB11|nr:DUF4136 domain-containing protein [Microbulbifer agarilyticus]